MRLPKPCRLQSPGQSTGTVRFHGARFSRLHNASFSLISPMAERKLFGAFLIKVLILSWSTYLLMPSYWELGFQQSNVGAATKSSSPLLTSLSSSLSPFLAFLSPLPCNKCDVYTIAYILILYLVFKSWSIPRIVTIENSGRERSVDKKGLIEERTPVEGV